MPSKNTVPGGGRQAKTLGARLGGALTALRELAGSWRAAAPFQRQILNGLQDGRPLYQGTASAKAVARRRARNEMARRSRRINRMRAAR